MGICSECGEKTKRNGKLCSKCRTSLYYEHAELRFVMWKFIKHHGITLAKELYNSMVAEEGAEWVNKTLGEKLVATLNQGN